MKSILTVLTIATVTVLTGVFASAEDDNAKQGAEDRPDRAQMREKMIERFDADGDGKLSDDERAKARAERGGRKGREGREDRANRRPGPEQLFERFDADGDNHLSREEFMELSEAVRNMRERMGAAREGGPRQARRPRGDRPKPAPEDGDRPRRRPRGDSFDGDRFRPLENQDSPEAEERRRPPRERARDRGRDQERGNKAKRGGPRGPEGRRPEGGPMGPPDPEQVFKDFDANGDDKLSLDEFKELAKEMRARRGRQGRGRGAFGPPGPALEGDSEGRPPRGKRRGRPGPDFGDAPPQPPEAPADESSLEEQSV